ncbi:MAG: ureidoglycolate lyase [Polyangiales bacterium]
MIGSLTMREVRARPLSLSDWSPYGALLAARDEADAGRSANQGNARVFDRLVDLRNARPGAAALNVSAFRARPRDVSDGLVVELLEKHPRSTQLFVPMGAARYLVVVALGGDAPDLSTLAAFVATGRQGVAYGPGVWHHPIVALDEPTDFACFVHEDGSADDCTLCRLDEASRVRVRV